MIAFVCNSPVHIMRAIQLSKRERGFEGQADLFVSDIFRGADVLVKNLRQMSVFRKVVLVEMAKIDGAPLAELVYGRGPLGKMFRQGSYTKLVAFNTSSKQVDALYDLNSRRPGFEFHCVEDGPAIYTIPWYEDYPWWHVNRLIGLRHARFHIRYWWTSCPDYIRLPAGCPAEKRALAPIDLNDEELVRIIDQAFGYRRDEALERADVLIMDESHFQDGLMRDDADCKLYQKIVGRYPERNFLVKMHPRTKGNRYEGWVRTMKGSYIPWEVYVMNRARQKDKPLLQISISCATMLSDKLMFDHEGPKIFLAPLFYDKIRTERGQAPRVSPAATEKIAAFTSTYNRPESFAIVHTEEELFRALDRFLR